MSTISISLRCHCACSSTNRRYSPASTKSTSVGTANCKPGSSESSATCRALFSSALDTWSAILFLFSLASDASSDITASPEPTSLASRASILTIVPSITDWTDLDRMDGTTFPYAVDTTSTIDTIAHVTEATTSPTTPHATARPDFEPTRPRTNKRVGSNSGWDLTERRFRASPDSHTRYLPTSVPDGCPTLRLSRNLPLK